MIHNGTTSDPKGDPKVTQNESNRDTKGNPIVSQKRTSVSKREPKCHKRGPERDPKGDPKVAQKGVTKGTRNVSQRCYERVSKSDEKGIQLVRFLFKPYPFTGSSLCPSDIQRPPRRRPGLEMCGFPARGGPSRHYRTFIEPL